MAPRQALYLPSHEVYSIYFSLNDRSLETHKTGLLLKSRKGIFEEQRLLVKDPS